MLLLLLVVDIGTLAQGCGVFSVVSRVGFNVLLSEAVPLDQWVKLECAAPAVLTASRGRNRIPTCIMGWVLLWGPVSAFSIMLVSSSRNLDRLTVSTGVAA